MSKALLRHNILATNLRQMLKNKIFYQLWTEPLHYHHHRRRRHCRRRRHHHHHLSLNHEGRWGTTDDFTQFPPFFAVLHCPLELCDFQACPFPDFVFPPLPLSALSFYPFLLCLARWSWSDPMNGRHDRTTALCIPLRWSGGLRAVWLPAG